MKQLIISLSIILASLNGASQNFWNYDDHDLVFEMPEISLVSVLPSNYTVNLSLGLPRKAGDKPGEDDESVDDNSWLNYSCSVRQNGSRRKVYAQVSNGDIPEGVAVELTVKDLQVNGRGNCGRSNGRTITLSNQPQVVVTNIGGGSTRRGRDYGHQLIYQLKLVDIEDLVLDEPRTYLTVTYTISD